jgi:serine/threonine-protein kinase
MLRFEREAQAAGRIGSDHILEVLDLGSLEDGSRYMVMEFLDGEPLSARIESLGKLTPRQVSELMRQALRGLQAAHDAGIIHRDLKPDNIFVVKEKAGQKDYVKIIDFGISKFNVLGSDMNMTRTGAVMGTPYYMSPEQAKGSSQVDPRSDVYAIGVIMYEALTGRVPFDGDTFNELMFKIVLSEPPPLAEVQPDIDPTFATIVNRAMARELGDRFSSAAELMHALEAYLAGSPIALPAAAGAGVGGGATQAEAPAGPGQTGETWANTQSEVQVPKRSSAPLFAAVAVLVLAGGAFGAYQVVAGGSDPGEEAAAAQASAEAAAAEATAEPAAVPEVAPVAAPAPEPEASADAEPEPADTEEKADEPPKPAVPAKKAVAPKPKAFKPKAAAPPAPPPKAAPPPPKPKKASSKDFGY